MSAKQNVKSGIEDKHDKQQIFECALCQKSYSRQPSLDRHMNSVHFGIRFKCHICGLALVSKTVLQRHILTVHEGARPFSCAQCDKIFTSSLALKYHINTYHISDKPNLKCNKCEKVFSGIIQFKARSVRHGAEKRHKCNTCCKSFFLKQELQTHERVHRPKVNSFNCNLCEKPFTSYTGRRYHLKYYHGLGNTKSLYCVFCDKQCKTKQNLYDHIQRLIKEKSFQCELSPLTFNSNTEKKLHMLIHTREKPYQCKVCNFSCCTSSSLKMHLTRHSVQKRYHCVFCNKGFPRQALLWEHNLLEIGERWYKCQVCKNEFTSNSQLLAHCKTHLPPQFQCTYCEKVYKRGFVLKLHVLKWHPAEK